MGCKKNQASCCNMEVVEHCVACDWTLQGGTGSAVVNSQVIYTADGLCPTVSGKVKFCTISFSGTGTPPSTGPQFVNLQFFRGTFLIETVQVPIGSCVAFTVAKFDSIVVSRTTPDNTAFTLAGEFCLTPTFTTH